MSRDENTSKVVIDRNFAKWLNERVKIENNKNQFCINLKTNNCIVENILSK